MILTDAGKIIGSELFLYYQGDRKITISNDKQPVTFDEGHGTGAGGGVLP